MATKLNPEAVIDASITKQKLSSQLQSELTDASEHISNSTVHITAAERTGWNGKADQNGNYPNLHVGVADNLLDKGDIQRDEEIMFRPTAGELSVSNGQATIEKIKGKTIVWNQLVQNGNFVDGTTYWGAYQSTISSSSGIATATSLGSGTFFGLRQQINVTQGHKVYIRAEVQGVNLNHNIRIGFNATAITDSSTGNFVLADKIETIGTSDYLYIVSSINEVGSEKSINVKNVMLIDLTQMFGAGNEPSTVEEFEAMFPKNYYDYNPGQLISFNGEEIKTTGFNQWDEEWEVGSINDTTGQNEVYSNWWRCKNYIKCIPGITYHYTNIGSTLPTFRIYFYDADKKFITYQSTSRYFDSNGNFVIPQNAYYFRFRFAQEHHSDDVICFNFHHTGIRDGQYEPYTEHTKTLPDLSNFDVTYTGADGQTHIAGGLKSAGSVYDEQTDTKDIRRIGVVDLGTLNWGVSPQSSYTRAARAELTGASIQSESICPLFTYIDNGHSAWIQDSKIDESITIDRDYVGISSSTIVQGKTVSQIKASLAGVLLYYELATPVETEVQFRNMYYSVDDYGTEELLPENTSTPTTTPMIADIKYGFNAVDLVRTIPDLTDRVEELEEDVKSISYGTCSTAAGTAEKVVVLDSGAAFTLKPGAIVTVKFSNNNSASGCTLNVEGTGAKSIWYNNAIYTGNSTDICGKTNTYYTYLYDGTYWIWIGNGRQYTYTEGNLRTYYSSYYTGENKLQPYTLCALDKNGLVVGIVNEASTGTGKTPTLSAFRPETLMVYYSGGSAAANSMVSHATLYWNHGGTINYRYSLNSAWAPNQEIYLCGSYNDTTGLFTLNEAGTAGSTGYYVLVPSNTNITLSSYFTSGKDYIYVGRTYYQQNTGYTQYQLSEHRIYRFDGTNLTLHTATKKYVDNAIENRLRVIPVTYSELKTLKNSSQLIPGQFYRITDYTCVTSQEGTRSANHPFDIIVQADSESVLNENAHAALHSGDTYFASEKLEAWELKYALEDDGSRFAWVASTQGPGDYRIKVVFQGGTRELDRMINNFGEDKTVNGVKYYSFVEYMSPTYYDSGSIVYAKVENPTSGYTDLYTWYNSSMRKEIMTVQESSFIPDPVVPCNHKGVIYYMKDEYGNEIDYDFKNIQFLRDSTWKAQKGSSLDSLTFGDVASYLTASDDYYYTFTYIDGNNVVYDMSLYETYRNISGASKGSGVGWMCRNNKIISNANDNKLCYKLSNNIFVGNETGPSNARFVSDNQISGGYSNTFGGRNIFSNTFLGSFFYNNTFADGGYSSFNYVNGAVYQNIFNGQFQNNYFYGGARQNTFKDTITYNVFMGDWLTGVVSNKILRGCRFGSKIQYVKIDSSGQIDSYVIDSGLHGTSSNPLLVTLVSGSSVERHIAQDSDGNIVDYVPADLASAISQIDLVTATALTNLNSRIGNE